MNELLHTRQDLASPRQGPATSTEACHRDEGPAGHCAPAHRARSLEALGRRDFEEAYLKAAAISPAGVLDAHVPEAFWAVLDLVEAAVRTGRAQEAAAHVTAMREARIADLSPGLALLADASAALTAPAGEAGQPFEQALGVDGAEQWTFEFARVQLAFGEYLRRFRANKDAREQLRAAHDTFLALGARSWESRAASEMRATAPTHRKNEYLRRPSLTAQENQIASLAATGLTNKEIGRSLYLSPRTVGNHLYRIFPKLGISHRAGLRDALTAMAEGDDIPRRAVALSRPVGARESW